MGPMRCSMCGHESPAGSAFCLNCGSSLVPPTYAQTPVAPPGLPLTCGVCRGENPPGMKFCRNCGSALAVAPQVAAPPQVALPPQVPPGYGVPVAPASASTSPGPAAIAAAHHAMVSSPHPGHMQCPRCGAQTPIGFAYCQQCGLHMQALQPTDPGANARAQAAQGLSGRPASGTGPAAGHPLAPVDPQGATLAADGARAQAPIPLVPSAVAAGNIASGGRPASAALPAWGTAVLVNRDGTDGQRFALSGEWIVVGRAGADVAFEDDRFLARQHARFEHGTDGTVRVHPLDTLNGVFRRADGPVELGDGATILVGREVLRYELIEAEEVKVHPLVRHGVALFGSPPREPWGRLVQILPSGGHRDVRHLTGQEIVIGREEGDIVFRDDAFMSRRHAAITWDGRKASVTDLGSSNGTFVRVKGVTVLKHGDHVRMGDQLLRIELGK